MALVNPALLGEVRGSAGGITFSRNRGGAYIRKRSKPVNPNTQRQVDARNRVADLSIRWSLDLTQDQRDAWDEYAQNVPSSNKIGEAINLTGQNWYVASNALRLQAGLTRVDDAPIVFQRALTPAGFAVTASEATQELSVVFDTGEDWVSQDGAAMMVFMGLPQNAGRNFFNGPFRFAGAVAGDSVAPPTSPQTIAVPFPVAAGQKVWVQALVMLADGRNSPRALSTFLAAA